MNGKSFQDVNRKIIIKELVKMSAEFLHCSSKQENTEKTFVMAFVRVLVRIDKFNNSLAIK